MHLINWSSASVYCSFPSSQHPSKLQNIQQLHLRLYRFYMLNVKVHYGKIKTIQIKKDFPGENVFSLYVLFWDFSHLNKPRNQKSRLLELCPQMRPKSKCLSIMHKTTFEGKPNTAHQHWRHIPTVSMVVEVWGFGPVLKHRTWAPCSKWTNQ